MNPESNQPQHAQQPKKGIVATIAERRGITQAAAHQLILRGVTVLVAFLAIVFVLLTKTGVI